MERSALINKIKTRIDEVCVSGDVIVDVDVENTKPYDSIIDELLDECALEVLLKAPFYRLDVKSSALQPVKDDNNEGVGTITLPTDFLRLVSFRMKEWQRAVTAFALQGDDIAKKQANRFIRGGVAKPVAVLSKSGNTYKATYYSVSKNSEHELAEFLYIKKDTPESIADTQLVDAMCWVCAGKTLGIIGQPNLANVCYENAKGLMV